LRPQLYRGSAPPAFGLGLLLLLDGNPICGFLQVDRTRMIHGG
jgi:hypothetical protein